MISAVSEIWEYVENAVKSGFAPPLFPKNDRINHSGRNLSCRRNLKVCFSLLCRIWPRSVTGECTGGWRRGVVVSGVRQWTKLTHVGTGYNWDGWPSSGGYTISGCNQPTRSTQPCIPPGRLIEYQLRLGWRREYQLCRVAGNTGWSHMAREFP